MIAERENLFRVAHIDSVTDLRRAHAQGLIPSIVAPDVVILVDGVDPLRNEFEGLDQAFTDIVRRGGSFGIHLIMALTRWNELRPALTPLIGQRFELRLNDPAESTIQRAAAQALKGAGPGRVLTQDQLYGQVCLPILSDMEDSTIGEEITELAKLSTQAWNGPLAAPIRLLPDFLDPESLPDEFDSPEEIPFGLRQDTFETVNFGPNRDQHLLVFGDSRCGKTTLLTGLVRGFIARHTPEELVFAVIDPRGKLASEIPEPYLGGQASSVKDAHTLCTAVATELEKRLQDPHGSFPRVVVVVDDYDIVSAGGTHPLQPLLPHLPSARDLHLCVLLTRPVSGAARGLLDPAIQALRDTGGSSFIMSGDRSEGPILPKVYAEPFVAGRGRHISHGTSGTRIVQVAAFGLEAPHVN
jgi:S-DNA-T family DNA segregation ATPase FtsK/SpoIIIE